MKRLFALTTAALLIAAGPALAAAKVGAPAPAFKGADANGKPVSLADFNGKTVVLEWTNHECPYVNKHYGAGNMQKLQKEAAAKDIVWLTVISSAPGKQGHVTGAKANELTTSRGAAPAHVVLDADGAIGRAYEATATPNMYVIDPKGTLVYRGAIDDKATTDTDDIAKAKNYVQLALADVGAGRQVAKAETAPYGCSIKY